MIEIVAAKHKNINIRKASSSGGVFYELASYAIANNGYVFGVLWDEKWLAKYTYINNMKDIGPLMTSKYVLADLGDSYKKCKEFLDKNIFVLFVGVPCQTHGLLNFLGKNYENLIIVDLECHGLPEKKMWLDYLKANCRKKIKNINMRSKQEGWFNYGLNIKYINGVSKTNNNRVDCYLKNFLSDVYLRSCCYNCKFKNKNSIADIIIGDFWTINNYSSEFADNFGASFIFSRNTKGADVVKELNNLDKKIILFKSFNARLLGSVDNIDKQKLPYSKKCLSKKFIGIICNTFQQNYGGILQNYALQQILYRLNYIPVSLNATIKGNNDNCINYNPFIKKYINMRDLGCFDWIFNVPYNYINKDDFYGIIVGSDQVWRREWNNYKNVFLTFAKDWDIKKISYAASSGTSYWDYKEDETLEISESLKTFDGVSCREEDLCNMIKNNCTVNAVQTLDPTFLLSKKDYLNLCKNTTLKKDGDLFAYILDKNEYKNNLIQKCINTKRCALIEINKECVEEWILAFHRAKYIITDSFHGCVFSIIFKKPFICIINKERGESRFEIFKKIFNCNNNFISNNQKNISMDVLNNKIKFRKRFFLMRNLSKKFIIKNLKN